MAPIMTTRNAGRRTTATRGGRMGGQTGRGGRRTGEPTSRVGGLTGNQGGQRGDQGIRAFEGFDEVPDFSTVIAQQLQYLLPTIIAQVGNHASSIQGDVRSVNVSNGQNGYSYKEFMACNLKDYDRKRVHTRGREVAVGMTWEDFKVLMRKEFYPNKLARLVPHLVTSENKRIERNIYGLAPQIHAMVAAMEPTTIQSAVLKAGMLTDEAIRNGSLRKNTEKRGNGRELSRDGNVRDDNQRSRTGRVFATVTKPVRKEYTGTTP
ncbi:hypothetical protein Tco_0478371, partial [Tanacetum coccineum]